MSASYSHESLASTSLFTLYFSHTPPKCHAMPHRFVNDIREPRGHFIHDEIGNILSNFIFKATDRWGL